MKTQKLNAIEILEVKIKGQALAPIDIKMGEVTVSLMGKYNNDKYEWAMSIKKGNDKPILMQLLTLGVLSSSNGKVQLIAQNYNDDGVSIIANVDKKTKLFIEAFLTYFFSFQNLDDAVHYIVSFPKCLDFLHNDILLDDDNKIPKKLLNTYRKKL